MRSMKRVFAQRMLFLTQLSKLAQFKVSQGQSFWRQLIAHGWLPICLLLTTIPYLSPFLKYLTCNFDDLEPIEFKVITGEFSWFH